tara:strand:- start:187 stop:300 length:114 start_codon:yes stop_codon:yes gene_type:complete
MKGDMKEKEMLGMMTDIFFKSLIWKKITFFNTHLVEF